MIWNWQGNWKYSNASISDDISISFLFCDVNKQIQEEWEGNEAEIFPKSGNGRGMNKTKLWKWEGNEKIHSQNLRTWKIPFPIFKNWNERLSFPGIASNGNSRSSVTFLWLNCKHGSKKCISALQPSSNVPIAFKNGEMCPRRDTALGHHAKRKRPRRAFVDSSLQKNEFAKHLNLDLPNFLLPLKSAQTNLRQNWNAAYSDF